MPLLENIKKALREPQLCRPSWLVALSGGADSVALLLALREAGQRVEAAHCNFHLRGAESDGDEEFCRSLCERLGIKFHVAQFSTLASMERGESIEMAARRLRYAWFASLAEETRIGAVAVAHHLEDNAETLLLNLVRGSGAKGLGGMDEVTEMEIKIEGEKRKRLLILRPMLQITRAEIEEYLHNRHQAFVIDSTNADTAYRRNAMRHRLLPMLAEMNPSIVATLGETAKRLRQTDILAAFGQEAIESHYTAGISDGNPAYFGVRLNLKLLLEEYPHLKGAATTIVYNFLSHHGGFSPAVASEIIDGGLRNGAMFESQSHLCTVFHGCVEIVPKDTANAFDEGINIPENGETIRLGNFCITATRMPFEGMASIDRRSVCATLDAAAVSGGLRLRSLRQADRFCPFGMRGRSRLVSDYLTDRRRSRLQRLQAVAVCDNRGILWIAGETIDTRTAIKENTAEVVKLVIEPAENIPVKDSANR